MLQGLANLLWSYAKMTVPPVEVMMIIVNRMTELLQERDAPSHFDAQVCKGVSVWMACSGIDPVVCTRHSVDSGAHMLTVALTAFLVC